MATLNENLPHAGGFLVSEGNKTISRSDIIVKHGENLLAGAVIQKEQATGKFIAYDAGNSDVAEGQGSIGVLFDNVDAISADAAGVIVDGQAEVNGEELLYADDQDTGDREAAAAALLAVGIKVR